MEQYDQEKIMKTLFKDADYNFENIKENLRYLYQDDYNFYKHYKNIEKILDI